MRHLRITKKITSRDTPSLEKYLQEIARLELLSVEEEVDLARRVKKGDEKALELLIKANLRFVISVAKQYQHQGLSLPDLINEGNLGLIKAATKFDETKGFKFISYAVWWIRQSILQAISEQARVVRLPLNQVGSLGKIHKISSRFEQENERDPSTEELAEKLEMSKEKVAGTLKLNGRPMSFDAPFIDGEDNSLLDVMENKDSPVADSELMTDSLRKEITRTLSILTEKERNVLECYFGLGRQEMSLEAIGEELGLTKERTRQIKEKALKRLRHKSKNKLLRMYLG